MAVALRRLTIAFDPGRDAAAPSGPWRFLREDGPDSARVLVGRAVEEAAALAPCIFNLCAAAHGFAARRALGLSGAADGTAMARESVRDHALAILHHWPSAFGAAPDRAALAHLARPGPEGDAVLRQALVGPGDDPARFSLADLDGWLRAAPTGTARLLARVRREVDPAEGRMALTGLAPADVSTALSADLLRALPARETGALGRVAATPLMAALLAREGPSLFSRLLARLLDLFALLAPTGAPAVPDMRPGIGLAEAARGLLGHGAVVERGRVAAYRVLAPSAWNLAPGGLLERAFAVLVPRPEAPWIAPLLVSAINPCVPVTLALRGAPAHA